MAIGLEISPIIEPGDRPSQAGGPVHPAWRVARWAGLLGGPVRSVLVVEIGGERAFLDRAVGEGRRSALVGDAVDGDGAPERAAGARAVGDRQREHDRSADVVRL